MRGRRWLAGLIAAALMLGCCGAAEAPETAQNAAEATAETAVEEAAEVQRYAPEDITDEEVRGFVEALFAAAAGTTAEAETELRKELSEEEIALRNSANADYRAKTLPWLRAVFRPELTPEALRLEEELLLEEARLQTEAEAAETEAEAETEPKTEAEIEPEESYVPPCITPDSYEAFGQSETGLAYLALMQEMGGGDYERDLMLSWEICGMWLDQVDHRRLAQLNGDYRCWIYSPGTQIDYPVVQYKDNERYLKRMFNGRRNSAGTLFIDYRNLPDFQDPNTLIYGHHMRNDSMFGSLTDYGKQAYFEGHPFLLLMSESEISILQVFAGYTTDDRDHCYDIAISDEEDMKAFLKEAQRKSNFKAGVDVQLDDRLVTLSTCAYAFEDARYILIGRLISVWTAVQVGEILPEN